MAIIVSKIEPKIKLPTHEIKTMSPSQEEAENGVDDDGEIQLTKIQGVMAPILFLNGICIEFRSLHSFWLDWTKEVPTCGFEAEDRDNLFTTFGKPGLSNELQVQILPPFEDAYKKVNLMFYMTSMSIENGIIRGTGSYKVVDFIQPKYLSIGQKNTYEFCEHITEKTGLGLASNIDDTKDARYIYCRQQSYKDVLSKEITQSCADQDQVLEWWIDLWHNIILSNTQDRFTCEDKDEDMMVWIADREVTPEKTSVVKPIESTALFTNNPSFAGTDLFLEGYEQHTAGGAGMSVGTSVAACAYIDGKHDWDYTYVMDGDIDKDEFLNCEYMGEIYGEYNYFSSKAARQNFLTKLNSETLSIFTNCPSLGITRGDQVRVVWYDNDARISIKEDAFEKAGISTNNTGSWLDAFVMPKTDTNHLSLNYQVSGQYLVIGEFIKYENSQWQMEYLLTRPARTKIEFIPENNGELA